MKQIKTNQKQKTVKVKKDYLAKVKGMTFKDLTKQQKRKSGGVEIAEKKTAPLALSYGVRFGYIYIICLFFLGFFEKIDMLVDRIFF